MAGRADQVTGRARRPGALRRLLRPASWPDSYGLVVPMVVTTYAFAVFADRQWRVAVLVVAQTGTVWRVLHTSRARRWVRFAANIVFALALLGAVSSLLARGNSTLIGVTFLAGSVLYLVAPISIVRHIGMRDAVDRETLLGALCAYLLLGMAFGFAYRCLGALQPGPFFGDAGEGTPAQCLFFSFITMTTTGYGDLVPAGNLGQTLAVMEALIGQLFLVTAVAKVVEAWRPRGWQQPGRDAGNGDAGTGQPGPERE